MHDFQGDFAASDRAASWLAVAAAVVMAGLALVKGVEWVAAALLPPLYTACWAALALVLALLPLAFFRRLRVYAGTGIVLASYLFALTAWLASASLTGSLWGGWAVALGLLLFGGGVVPCALLATMWHGMWPQFQLLVGLLAAVLACCLVGGALIRSVR